VVHDFLRLVEGHVKWIFQFDLYRLPVFPDDPT
jgi:hypothetical protein